MVKPKKKVKCITEDDLDDLKYDVKCELRREVGTEVKEEFYRNFWNVVKFIGGFVFAAGAFLWYNVMLDYANVTSEVGGFVSKTSMVGQFGLWIIILALAIVCFMTLETD